MGGGVFSLIRASYNKEIKNKEKITNCFINNQTKEVEESIVQHTNMMCHVLLNDKDNLDKSHFIHTILEIYNSLNSIEKK